jgi:peptidoglycan/xylan/chitin deacetylase (PgdA/CDA1 family)
MAAHGIMFHHFHGRDHPRGQGSMSAEDLAALVDFVGRERFLPAKEWLRRASAGRLQPEDLCLTFDDNLKCQFDVAVPVLRELGLTAFWFVYTSVLEGQIERLEVYRAFRVTCFDHVDEFHAAFEDQVFSSECAVEAEQRLGDFEPSAYLVGFPFYSDSDRRFRFLRDEVLGPQRYVEIMDGMIAARGPGMKRLAANLWMDAARLQRLHTEGHVVGLHSHTHPTRLDRLDPRAQAEEYARNHASLRGVLGTAPVAMSHPCNSYDAGTLDVLRGLGIRLGFRANMAASGGSELEYPREDHANLLREMGTCASRSSPATSLATSR